MAWKIRQNGRQSAIQKCSECEIKLEPIFKAGHDPEDWFFTECDSCQEPVCEKCSDLIDDLRFCLTCLQDKNTKTDGPTK